MHVRMNRVACVVGLVGAVASGCTGGASEEQGQSTAAIRAGRVPATLSSRALINRDGTADFESSTGALDSATPATGGIELLDLSLFEGESVTFHRSFDVGGTPYFHSALTSVRRGQPFRVEAQVWSTSSGSAAAAIVTGTAKLRPDPSFAFIIGPDLPTIIGPDAPPGGIIGPDGFATIIGPDVGREGNPLPISVFFYEKNGDVGAKVDCVLLVDGVEAERTPEVSVAAGQLARCQFRHAFTGVGVHAISITLANVAPGDYNPLNNTVNGEVTIIGPDHH